MNMQNDLKEELDRRRRAARAAFEPLGELRTTDRSRTPYSYSIFLHSFMLQRHGQTLLPREQNGVPTQSAKPCLLMYNWRTQHQVGLQSPDLQRISHLRNPQEYVSKAKHRAGHITRREDDRWIGMTLEWIPRETKRRRGNHQRSGIMCSLCGWTSWTLTWKWDKFFVSVVHCMTVAREKIEWKRYPANQNRASSGAGGSVCIVMAILQRTDSAWWLWSPLAIHLAEQYACPYILREENLHDDVISCRTSDKLVCRWKRSKNIVETNYGCLAMRKAMIAWLYILRMTSPVR